MHMVKNTLIMLFLGWFSLLLLMPKQELYFKIEKALEKNEIKINEERIESGIFSLNVYQADIYVKGIKFASVEEINFFTLLFYTKVDLEKLVLDEALKSMVSVQTESATFSHALWSPFDITVEIEGSFGLAEGYVQLNQEEGAVLRVDFNDSAAIESLKPKLQEDEKGWYYETSF